MVDEALGCGQTYRKDDGTTAQCTAMAPCPACVAHYAALDQPVPALPGTGAVADADPFPLMVEQLEDVPQLGENDKD